MVNTGVATRGVDEEAILKDLPMDLRREIKRHLCLDLVRKVSFWFLLSFPLIEQFCELLNKLLKLNS